MRRKLRSIHKPKTCRVRRPRKYRQFLVSEMGTIKVRPRIQQAFFQWLMANRHRLAIDIQIEDRTNRGIIFSFVGINPALWGGLGNDLDVMISHNDEEIGLRGFWANPQRMGGGYADNPFAAETFYTREHFWFAEVFEPFLIWVNETLTRSQWIELWFSNSGSSDAILLAAEIPKRKVHPEFSYEILPLWVQTP